MDCIARQAPRSTGIFQGRIQSGLPFPPPGDSPNPGIELRSPLWQTDSLSSEPPGKPNKPFYSLPQRSKCHSSAPPPPLLLGSRWSRWDRLRPGTWSPLLRCLGRNTHLLEQQIQTIKGYKWSSAGRVGANYEQVTKRLNRKQLPLPRCWKQTQGSTRHPYTQPQEGGGLSHPSPWPVPIKGPACSPTERERGHLTHPILLQHHPSVKPPWNSSC